MSNIDNIRNKIDKMKTELAVMESKKKDLQKELRRYKIVTIEDALKIQKQIEKEVGVLQDRAQKLLTTVERTLKDYESL